jgi:tetratricopeptide (TPR) repeat protein
MRRFLPLPIGLLALAACNPNIALGPSAPDAPPAWDAPPRAEDDGGNGGGNAGGAPMMKMVSDLRAKIDADPKDVVSRKQLAALEAQIGRWDDANQLLQEAEAIDPSDVEIRVQRVNILLERKDQGAALQELQAADKLNKDDEGVLRGWGGYYLLTEDLDKAIAVRKKLLAKYPDVEDAENLELWNYYLSKVPSLKASGKLKDFFDLIAAGSRAQDSGKDADALDDFQKAAAILPDDPNVQVSIGVAQRHLGKKPEGMASFKKALSIDKSSSKAQLEIARSLYEDGDPKAATTVLREWQKADPRRAKRHDVDGILARIDKGGPFEAAPEGHPAATAAMPAATTAVASSAGGDGVTGTITLAPDLVSKVKPGAKLFVFAKSQPGGGPPLAVTVLPVGSFPATFSLTSANAMMGQPLAGPIYLTARVDADGMAGRGPGDLEGTIAQPVQVGSAGITIAIDSWVDADGTLKKSAGGAAPTPAPTVAAPSSGGEAGSIGQISGSVELSPALKAKLGALPAGARLFIFAKAQPGPGAPIAVQVEPVPASFPVSFQLTSENVMMEGSDFQGPLYLTARVDMDGSAGGSPGDLEGVTKTPVQVGTRGVTLTIDTVR